MAIRVIVGIVALGCVSACGVASAVMSCDLMDKVNVRLPAEEQFALLGWYYPKTQRLYREYRRLYPAGRLILKVRTFATLTFACIAICAWGFGGL